MTCDPAMVARILGAPVLPASDADPQCVVDAMAELDLETARTVYELIGEPRG